MVLQAIKGHTIPVILAIIFGSLVASYFNYEIKTQRQLTQVINKNEPVVRDMFIIDSRIENDSLYIHVIGKRNREGCGPPIFRTGLYGTNLEKQLIKFNFSDDKNPDGTFKIPDTNPGLKGEEIDFGWWELSPNPFPYDMYLTVLNKCGNNLIETVIGLYKPEDYMKGK